MADIAHEETDRILNQMVKKVKAHYRIANRDIEKKLSDYLEKFRVKDEKKRQLLNEGKITAEEYRKWRTGQIMISKRWREMRDSLADDYVNANKIAMNIVNGYTEDVYALNHNYATFEIEKGSLVNTSYTLYDRHTVERLLRDEPDLLPKARVNVSEDRKWNRKKINSAITQGILQGEDLNKMSKRLSSVTDMNRRVAVRNARTMVTSAENGGRMDSYKRAESMGIKMRKQWVATLDGRTRDSHRHADGMIVDTDEPFELDEGEVMFPGDPNGPAGEIYNCRCTMVSVVEGIDPSINPDDIQRNSRLGDMSYSEWKEGHKKR